MTYNIKILIALPLLALCLAACGTSPQSNYYLLTPKQMPSASGQQPSLGVGPISIPEYLNRTGLVYSRDGNQLQIASQERWAEPLEDGIGRVLGLNLANLLNTENVRYFPWSAARAPDYGITVNVLTLDANDGEAVLVAEWLVYRASNGEPVSRRISQLQQALPAGPVQASQLAPVYSALLYQLSEMIAAAVTAAD